jgi:hypothetical protein
MGTKLRLVGAKRYVDARISTTSAVTYGQIVDIKDPDIADQLLTVTFINKYNEPAPMFDMVDDSDEEEAPKPRAARRKTTRRTKTAA